MNKNIHFTKMHGAGNDYIYINTLLYHIADPSEAARRWSKSHTGIGSDGLVLIGEALDKAKADFSMRIFNADGSEAMMCGNASRCIGKYLYEKGLTRKTEIRLETLSGVKILRLHLSESGQEVESVTVDMGEPAWDVRSQFNPSLDSGKGRFVSMGNPHYVIFTDKEDDTHLKKTGRELEHHASFPEGCNIEMARLVGTNHIRMRVWERGSGITMACGTGACATAVVAAASGRTGSKSQVEMDGGTLEIEWNEKDNHVYMTGPAAFVFEGEIKAD